MVLSIDTAGTIIDRIRSTAYGEPQRYSLLDLVTGTPGAVTTNVPNGIVNSADIAAFNTAYNASNLLADLAGDGAVDGNDYTLYVNELSESPPLGTGALSTDLDAGFRRGFAGYEFDPVLGASYASIHHVRNRVCHAGGSCTSAAHPWAF